MQFLCHNAYYNTRGRKNSAVFDSPAIRKGNIRILMCCHRALCAFYGYFRVGLCSVMLNDDDAVNADVVLIF